MCELGLCPEGGRFLVCKHGILDVWACLLRLFGGVSLSREGGSWFWVVSVDSACDGVRVLGVLGQSLLLGV